MYQLTFTTVHGLYQEQYASRENMTDVVVQNLISDQKVRLRMNDYVKKIAVYRDRLAVQLADSVRLFTSVTDSGTGQLEYRPLGTISRNLDCNLLVVTKHHIILCHEKQLQLYGFSGEQEREWVLDSVIRYIKVVGGPPGREGLLVGVKSGGIFKIFVDNPFPVPLVKHPNNIRCLDLSASRTRLAVVDDKTSVVVRATRRSGSQRGGTQLLHEMRERCSERRESLTRNAQGALLELLSPPSPRCMISRPGSPPSRPPVGTVWCVSGSRAHGLTAERMCVCARVAVLPVSGAACACAALPRIGHAVTAPRVDWRKSPR